MCDVEDVYHIPLTSNVEWDSVLADLLWSEPGEAEGSGGWELSPTSLGYSFSSAVLQEFFDRCKFKLMLRGHETFDEGIRCDFDGRVITVSSVIGHAPLGASRGAVVLIDEEGHPHYRHLTAGQQSRLLSEDELIDFI